MLLFEMRVVQLGTPGRVSALLADVDFVAALFVRVLHVAAVYLATV